MSSKKHFPSDKQAILRLVEGVAKSHKRLLFRASDGKIVALVSEKDLETLEDSDDVRMLETLYGEPNREPPVPLEQVTRALLPN